MSIVLQRIYDKDPQLGGHRVLIDRVWPRGISKQDANLDKWMKEIAPSSSLRKWFNHEPEKFKQFKQAYKNEIKQDVVRRAKLSELEQIQTKERLVLLYGAKDEVYNHAIVLKEILLEK